MPVVDQSSPVTDVQQAVPVAQWFAWPSRKTWEEVRVELRSRDGSVWQEIASDFQYWMNSAAGDMCDDVVAFRIVDETPLPLPCKSGEGAEASGGAAWTTHTGGDCPVDLDATVDTITRSGATATMRASAIIWRYGSTIYEIMEPLPSSAEVVFYRLARSPELARFPDIGTDPMKGDRADRIEQSLAACREAYVKQQKGVPDQTALVWRWHLGALLECATRLKAILSRPDATQTREAEGGEAVARAHADKWRKRAAKHTRANGRRSDCEQADLARAKLCDDIANDIAALNARGGA